MAFTLAPGEEVRAEIEFEGRGGGLFFTPSFHLRVTNFRFSVTESLNRGSETTKYIPLESIIYVQEGNYSTPRYLWFAIACAVAGIIVTVGTFGIGIIVGIPLFVLGAIFLFRYFMTRAQGLLVQSGGEDIAMVMGGARSRRIQEVLEALEAARLERTAPDHSSSAIESGTPPALPEFQ